MENHPASQGKERAEEKGRRWGWPNINIVVKFVWYGLVWFVPAFHSGGFLFLINEHHEINPWSGCTEFQFGLSCWFDVRMKISTECLFLGSCFSTFVTILFAMVVYIRYTPLIYYLGEVRLHHVRFHCIVSPFCKLTGFMKSCKWQKLHVDLFTVF